MRLIHITQRTYIYTIYIFLLQIYGAHFGSDISKKYKNKMIRHFFKL